MAEKVVKRRKLELFRKIPFDCWTSLVQYLDSPKDFISIGGVVKGLLEYIGNNFPTCTRNIEFPLKLSKKGETHPKSVRKFVSSLKIMDWSRDTYERVQKFWLYNNLRIGELFPNLTKLHISLTARKSQKYNILLNLAKLKSLNIESIRGNTDVILSWETLPSLESLSLTGVEISRPPIKFALRIKCLELCNSSFFCMVNIGWESFDSIEYLKLVNTPMRRVFSIAKLRKVVFRNSRTVERLRFSGCTSLRDLELERSERSNKQITVYIFMCPQLKNIKCLRRDTKILLLDSNKGLELQNVELGRRCAVGVQEAFKKYVYKLESFSGFDEGSEVHERNVAKKDKTKEKQKFLNILDFVQSMKKLKNFDIGYTRIIPATGTRKTYQFSNVTSLESVSVQSNCRLGLISNCEKLQYLKVGKRVYLTEDFGVVNVPSLRFLSVSVANKKGLDNILDILEREGVKLLDLEVVGNDLTCLDTRRLCKLCKMFSFRPRKASYDPVDISDDSSSDFDSSSESDISGTDTLPDTYGTLLEFL